MREDNKKWQQQRRSTISKNVDTSEHSSYKMNARQITNKLQLNNFPFVLAFHCALSAHYFFIFYFFFALSLIFYISFIFTVFYCIFNSITFLDSFAWNRFRRNVDFLLSPFLSILKIGTKEKARVSFSWIFVFQQIFFLVVLFLCFSVIRLFIFFCEILFSTHKLFRNSFTVLWLLLLVYSVADHNFFTLSFFCLFAFYPYYCFLSLSDFILFFTRDRWQYLQPTYKRAECTMGVLACVFPAMVGESKR